MITTDKFPKHIPREDLEINTTVLYHLLYDIDMWEPYGMGPKYIAKSDYAYLTMRPYILDKTIIFVTGEFLERQSDYISLPPLVWDSYGVDWCLRRLV